jgi:CHAT domain-containing protein
MIKGIIINILTLTLNIPLSGQCPDRDFLWHRIIYLRDSTHIPEREQLTELTDYLSKINTCPYRNDSTHALLLLRIGWLYSTQKDFKKAIEFTAFSIQMINRNIASPDINETLLIKCYNNLRLLYDSTAQNTLKIRAMDSCISYAVKFKTGYHYAIQLIDWEIKYYFEKGDYYKCINYIKLAEDITRKSNYKPEDIFYLLSWEINSLLSLHKTDDAESLVNRSISEYLATKNKKYLGTLIGLKAKIADERGDEQAALHYSKISFDLNKKIENYGGCYSILNNLGYDLYYTKLHQSDKALTFYVQSLKYANKNDSINTYDNIANIYSEKGIPDSAKFYFDKAFNKIYPGAEIKNLFDKASGDLLNGINVEYLINLVLDKAESSLIQYKKTNNNKFVQEANQFYRAADQLMAQAKLILTDVSSKLFWQADLRRLYDKAIESCYLSHNMESAFSFFEKSRAVLLNDQLREQATGDPNIEEMASVKKKILNLERRVNAFDPSTKAYSDAQRELFIDKEQLSRLDQLIKTKNPWYYQSILDTNFVSLKEIQEKLLDKNDSSTILEFFYGDSAVYLLSITRDKTKISMINKIKFETVVDRYNLFLSNAALENQDFNGFVKTGQDLYHLIFKDSDLPTGRIIISPDGGYFPFEALVINKNISQPEYFVNNYVVSYTYSVRFLLSEFTSNKTVSSGNFLGVAPVQYPSSFNLSPLLQSDASLKKINSHFRNADMLVASQATRNNFMQQFQDYKIIQLYTHASDTSVYGEPVIYFSDSALYLSELIPEGKIATRLIVLSACETGNGKLYKGEGVFSFNRGFASLGIPSSVINLWSVDDESTYRLTELFYKYVNKGFSLDLALQKAKLEFISSSSREKRLPYYWAAAVLVGKSDKIEMLNGMGWRYVYFALGILFLIYLAWKLIKKNFGKLRAKQ